MMLAKVFPELPLLNDIAERVPLSGRSTLPDTILICQQHLLPTTGSLIESLIQLGLEPPNLFVLGKCYSTCEQVRTQLQGLGATILDGNRPSAPGEYRHVIDHDIQLLWTVVSQSVSQRQPKRLIVLDDGGHLLSTVPEALFSICSVVGINQTTSGLDGHIDSTKFPIIDVARSAVKRIVEPTFIADAVLTAVFQDEKTSAGQVHGVVGLGQVGQAVAQALVARGEELLLFDLKEMGPFIPEAILCDNINDVVERCDVVFGCTGQDILDRAVHGSIRRNACLVSCSSGDVEFRSVLLRMERTTEVFGTLHCEIPDRPGTFSVLNGGFPVNFNREIELEQPENIQITRSLLLAAIIQGILWDESRETNRRFALNAKLQRFIFRRWQAFTGYQTRSPWTDKWIGERSGGAPAPCQGLQEYY